MTHEEHRLLKHPTTSTYQYYNANPKNKITTDCVIRAIARATEQDYNKVVMDLAEFQVRTGYDDGETKCYGKYLETLGWKRHSQEKKLDGTKYTGKEFCERLNSLYPAGYPGNVIAHMGGHHIVCIVPMDKGNKYTCKHKVLDTWNSTGGCVGVWWTKED